MNMNVTDFQGWQPCDPGTVAVRDEGELDVTPRQYLAFAQQDLAEPQSPRALINSLGHAKRAIHLQIDLVLGAFGFQDPRELSFPHKLELCASCGIIVPGILRRLNRLRNVVEHEYRCPTLDEVQDATDIAELFIEAIHGFLRIFPYSLRLQSPAGQPKTALYLRLEPRSGALNICQCGPAPAGDEHSVVHSSSALYPEWVEFMVRMTR